MPLKEKSILKFLNKVNKRIPIENSRPAIANKKKDIEYKLISSFKLPLKTESVYRVTHKISENRSMLKKLDLLKINTKTANQKKVFQKESHDSIF